jgi:PhnB protein
MKMPGSGCRSPQTLGGSTVNIFLYVKDADSAFKQAVSAGAKVETELADMFWGDRYGKLTDPFGQEDVTTEEMQKRSQAAMSAMAQKTRTAGEYR